MSLYRLLKGSIRESDLIFRIGEHRIVAILAGAEGKGEVIEFLSSRYRELQIEFGVFQGHFYNPEGFKALSYSTSTWSARDNKLIWQALSLTSLEIAFVENNSATNRQQLTKIA